MWSPGLDSEEEDKRTGKGAKGMALSQEGKGKGKNES